MERAALTALPYTASAWRGHWQKLIGLKMTGCHCWQNMKIASHTYFASSLVLPGARDSQEAPSPVSKRSWRQILNWLNWLENTSWSLPVVACDQTGDWQERTEQCQWQSSKNATGSQPSEAGRAVTTRETRVRFRLLTIEETATAYFASQTQKLVSTRDTTLLLVEL